MFGARSRHHFVRFADEKSMGVILFKTLACMAEISHFLKEICEIGDPPEKVAKQN